VTPSWVPGPGRLARPDLGRRGPGPRSESRLGHRDRVTVTRTVLSPSHESGIVRFRPPSRAAKSSRRQLESDGSPACQAATVTVTGRRRRPRCRPGGPDWPPGHSKSESGASQAGTAWAVPAQGRGTVTGRVRLVSRRWCRVAPVGHGPDHGPGEPQRRPGARLSLKGAVAPSCSAGPASRTGRPGPPGRWQFRPAAG
jgi:hypothetical protein